MELIEKLNNESNFHLSLKSILVSNNLEIVDSYLKNINKTTYVIDNTKDYYIQLKEAFNLKVDYVLYDKLTILNPILVIILNGNENLIHPFITTIHNCKDSKVAIKLVKKARLENSTLVKIKNIEEIKEYIK